MRATAWEFRYRLWLSFVIIAVGFVAPWIEWLQWGNRGTHTWGWLASQLGRLGVPPTTSFDLVAALAIAVAGLAAVLRISGTAYLGTGTVFHSEMKDGAERMAGQVMADGPYRHMRNPLYAGSYLTVVALTILMTPSGAAFTLVLLAVFLLRLILGEEAFLSLRLGESYTTYCKAVPRLLPSLLPRFPAGGHSPQWGRACLGEIFPIGVVFSFAALSWQFNPELLTQSVLVSFGFSLVIRAIILPKPQATPLTP